MEYSFVESNTGKIRRIDSFDETPQQTNPSNGKWVRDIVPSFNPQTHECVKRDPQPIPYPESIVYNLIPKDIALVKAAKVSELTAAREQAILKDVAALGTSWQADERSQKLISSVITLAQAGLPLPPVWRDVFNTDVPITDISQLLQIAGAIAQQTQAAYSQLWAAKAQVDAATTVEQVSAIVWQT